LHTLPPPAPNAPSDALIFAVHAGTGNSYTEPDFRAAACTKKAARRETNVLSLSIPRPLVPCHRRAAHGARPCLRCIRGLTRSGAFCVLFRARSARQRREAGLCRCSAPGPLPRSSRDVRRRAPTMVTYACARGGNLITRPHRAREQSEQPPSQPATSALHALFARCALARVDDVELRSAAQLQAHQMTARRARAAGAAALSTGVAGQRARSATRAPPPAQPAYRRRRAPIPRLHAA